MLDLIIVGFTMHLKPKSPYFLFGVLILVLSESSQEPEMSVRLLYTYRLDVTTDQVALQIYTCNGIESPVDIARKKDQGGPTTNYTVSGLQPKHF